MRRTGRRDGVPCLLALVDWKRVAAFVRAARMPYWRTQRDFAIDAGISPRLANDIETGRRGNFSPHTLAAVEAALGWEPGSMLDVARGGAPRLERDDAFRRIENAWPHLSAGERGMLADLAERAIRR